MNSNELFGIRQLVVAKEIALKHENFEDLCNDNSRIVFTLESIPLRLDKAVLFWLLFDQYYSGWQQLPLISGFIQTEPFLHHGYQVGALLSSTSRRHPDYIVLWLSFSSSFPINSVLCFKSHFENEVWWENGIGRNQPTSTSSFITLA